MKKALRTILETIRFVAVVLIIVVPVRAYVAQPFVVNGNSMSPTFENGQYLIIDELSYYLREPARGEVVVFRYPKNPKTFFIKRLIGLPGETVIIKDNQNNHIHTHKWNVVENGNYFYQKLWLYCKKRIDEGKIFRGKFN